MRYFIGFLITIGLVILLIILLFGGGGNKQEVPTTSKALPSYSSTNAEAVMTIDGPVNAASEHDQVRITVDRNNVTYEEIRGYNGEVTEMRRFDNSEEAYNNFLYALQRAGYTQGNTDKSLANERGYCSLGSRYIFEFKQDTRQLQRFWATSCGNPKTFQGNLGIALDLFQAQVPNYLELSENLILQ